MDSSSTKSRRCENSEFQAFVKRIIRAHGRGATDCTADFLEGGDQ